MLAQIDRDISASILLNRSLSEGFGELPLQQLTLDCCRQLSLPESFIRLQIPDENFMKCCKAVARLPESIVEHHLFKDAATLNLSYANFWWRCPNGSEI